jgi:hypothetical protein
MHVIAGTRIEARCASITGITSTYAEPGGRVISDHRHNRQIRVSAGTQIVDQRAQIIRFGVTSGGHLAEPVPIISAAMRAPAATKMTTERDGDGRLAAGAAPVSLPVCGSRGTRAG